MRNSIQCLVISGGRLDDGLRTALYIAARKLIRSGNKSIRFVDENGEGGVSTRQQRRVVSSYLVGIEFHATVETRDGSVKCRFLVNDIGMPTEDEIFEGDWKWLPAPFSMHDQDADEDEEWENN